MKQTTLSLILLFTLGSFGHPCKSIYPETAKIDANEEVKDFLKNFELQLKQHDAEGMLEFMDPKYLEEQYTGMLKGNTEQFLKEFFCGEDQKTNEFKCVAYQSIKKLKLQGLVKADGGFEVRYIIVAKGFKVNTEWFIKEMMDGPTYSYGLVGALG